ncbi:MAG: TonB-dependent receptor plug domain-containing protein, partial [Bacteroidales bacterium]|nr:TonB-dependent receptor plug domain-containing protein [Bacteroidales bacterium]
MNRLLIKILFSIILTATAGVAFSQKTITGKVFDDNNVPLIGASISVKGTPIMTLSKSNGSYSLTIPPEHENDTIEVRYVGFVTQKFLPNSESRDIYFDVEGIKAVEVIVVSTQKRLQSSLEVPIAITAFDQNRLDELYATQIDEISCFVSGFNNIIQGQNKAGYSIRGVTSDGMESFFQPRISVFLNNITVSREQVSALEPFDMERIEVVKGPQGTLFGRGAEIGAVHFITKHPTNTFSANLRLNYGGYNQRGAQGYVNLPISEKVADRLAFSYDYHDGYIKNLAGGCLNGKNAFAIRNTLSIRNNDVSSLSLILDFQMDDAPGVSFKSKKIAPI